MKIDDFEFEVAQSQIALRPPPVRSHSRLLVDDGSLSHNRWFFDIAEYFGDNDVLVLNNTLVRKARTKFQRSSGGIVELLWLGPVESSQDVWRAFGQTRKLKPGESLTCVDNSEISVVIDSIDGDHCTIGVPANFESIIQQHGELAIPPYITSQRRQTSLTQQQWAELDADRYQTTFADGNPDSVAAPTASLHWTPQILAQLQAKGVEIVPVHHVVGPGTFKPVRVDDINDHKVDAEHTVLTEESAQRLRHAQDNGKRITCCGTTATRAIEFAWQSNQFRSAIDTNNDLTIVPGHKFVTDRIVTNFHLPRSSLLLLVAAFVGDRWRDIYQHAVKHQYRFYSYGDASLLTKAS